mgnify:CR=1 FL=1
MRIPQLDRINELANKANIVGLTEAEQAERVLLRQVYVRAVTGQMHNMLATLTVVDPEGNDVTPKALRLAQRSERWLTRLWPDSPALRDAVRELHSLRQAPLEIQSPLLDSSLRQLRALRDNPGTR